MTELRTVDALAVTEGFPQLKPATGYLDLSQCVETKIKLSKAEVEQTSWLVSKFCSAT